MSFDQNKAEAFSGRLLGALNDAALCLMTSIGHRTGLFDTLSGLPPSTSAEIATAAGLNERYVREWLGTMVTSRVIDIDEASGKYSLPKEHAAFLTRAVNADNVAVFAQYIPLLGSVEDDIVECFQKGGGVPYSRYPRFHEVMAEDSGQSVLSSLFDHILPLAPGLTDKLTQGIAVLDIGCGSGRALNHMAGRFPNSTFHGYDLSEQAIETGRKLAKEQGHTNIHFSPKDLSRFDEQAEPEQFHLVTAFDAIHDQARPRSVLRGVCKALKSDGLFLMQDIRGSSHVHNNLEHPIGPLLYTISCLHCMTVSLAQGGEGLGAMWGEEKALEFLNEAGFTKVDIHQLPHDFQNSYYVIRKN